MTDWIILTTRPAQTLNLAASLAEAGFDVWTPIEVTKEAGKEMTAAIIKQIVFARSYHLSDLLELLHRPTLNYRIWDSEAQRMVTKGHPYFRVFRPFEGYACVPDASLDHLRLAEQKRKPRGSVKAYQVGDRVKILGAGFEGLNGVVIATKGKKATITFPNVGFSQDVTLPMEVLLDDVPVVHVSSDHSEQAHVAKAA